MVFNLSKLISRISKLLGANQYRIAINEKDIPNVFEIKTLEYIASTSWIENSNKPTYEYEDLSCKYVNNNTGVTVSFTIQRNKTTNELTVVNPAIENAVLTPIFRFENFNSFSCSAVYKCSNKWIFKWLHI